MTKSLWMIMMGMLLIFASCQSDDDFSSSDLPQTSQLRNLHFYGVKSVKDQPETRGVAQRDKLWNAGTAITVKLLNDPYNMADQIKEWVSEWEQHANISFKFVTSGSANVRIGFDWNDNKWVTWSYTGTDCKYIRSQNEATINFAFWDSANEQDKKGDVLRAFGQVLGLELEHRHLSFDPGWTSRIQQYWEGEIEDIPWDELREYVFDPISELNLVQTEEYDPNSIMIWPFDRRYATSTARDYNYELSEQDILFIKQLYPGKNELEEGVACMFKIRAIKEEDDYNTPVEFWFNLSSSATFTVNYGDGEEEVISSRYNVYQGHYIDFEHTFELGIQHSVKIYGDPELITGMYINGEGDTGHFEYVNISPCTELTEFNIELDYMGLSSEKVNLDLTKNTRLKNVNIVYSNNLASIDLSKNTELEELHLSDCESLNKLDLSKCINIRNIYLFYDLCQTTGFLENRTTAVEFANKLPSKIEDDGYLDINSYIETNFDPEWIQSICQSKGWQM